MLQWEINYQYLTQVIWLLLAWCRTCRKSIQKTISCHSCNSRILIIVVSEKCIYFLISTLKGCHELARHIRLHLAELWHNLTNAWKVTVCVHGIRWTVNISSIQPCWRKKKPSATDKPIWTAQSSHLNGTILLLPLYVKDSESPLLTTGKYRTIFMSWS